VGTRRQSIYEAVADLDADIVLLNGLIPLLRGGS